MYQTHPARPVTLARLIYHYRPDEPIVEQDECYQHPANTTEVVRHAEQLTVLANLSLTIPPGFDAVVRIERWDCGGEPYDYLVRWTR